MARKKSAESIETDITNVKAAMSKLQDRYDKLADQLKVLEEQKYQAEAEAIMEAYQKSGKSFDEIMTFLQP